MKSEPKKSPAITTGKELKKSLTKFSAILDDVNTTGGPGAWFIPIPA